MNKIGYTIASILCFGFYIYGQFTDGNPNDFTLTMLIMMAWFSLMAEIKELKE